MKNKVQIQRNIQEKAKIPQAQTSSSLAPKTAEISPAEKEAINSKLDPNLRKHARSWGSEYRFIYAERLRNWANQLVTSAIELEALEKVRTPGSSLLN